MNAYPYQCAGLLKVRIASIYDYEGLMRFEQYAELIGRLQQYDEWTKDRRMT